MKTLDQFDVEATIIYSGSYIDPIFKGNFFDRNRIIVGRHTSGSTEYLRAGNYSEYFDLYGAYRNTKLGIAQRFTKFTSEVERVYDTMLPSILDIYYTNSGSVVLANPELGASPILETTADADSTGVAVGKLIFVANGVTASLASDSTVKVGDSSWICSYPFQGTYRNLIRQVNQRFYQSRINVPQSESRNASNNVAFYGNGTGYLTSSLASIEVILPNSKLPGLTGIPLTEPQRFTMIDVTGSVDAVTNMFEGVGTFEYPPSASGLFGTSRGTRRPSEREVIKFFFGIGDNLQNISILNGVTSSYMNSTVGIMNGFYSTNAEIRGWKYGIYNAFPYYSNCVFRTNRFGQFRDMLEQRQYTKFFDPDGFNPLGKKNNKIGSKDSPVNIKFVSGSDAYVTASLPTLNTRDSGIYDFEYCSGAPFSD